VSERTGGPAVGLGRRDSKDPGAPSWPQGFLCGAGKPSACHRRSVGWLRHNRDMPMELSFTLGSSNRFWLTLRGNTNQLTAADGPVPRITIPLEGRVTERDIDVEILRLAFDLKIGSTVVGQGELGPYTHLTTGYTYLPVPASCPQSALPYLVNPDPPQGRITLTLAFKGLLRYRHNYPDGDERGRGLGESGSWHIEAFGNSSPHELEVQIARSDWYEQVVTQLHLGSYLITPVYLPHGLPSWKATLSHLDEVARAIVQPSPSGAFGACRAAIDALPGAKTAIFDAMPEGKKRDAVDDLAKAIGKYIHSGRHVVPNGDGEQAGEFPVDQRDAVFAQNLTKLLLSHIASLTLRP
jgi:hypothetical protein